MPRINSIRQLRKSGESVSAIAEQVGVSRDTVYKYINKDDFSPQPPKTTKCRPSILDPYKPLIDKWLDQDAKNWKKQRHTSRKIWQRLCNEYGAKVSEVTVSRYVAKQKATRLQLDDQFRAS